MSIPEYFTSPGPATVYFDTMGNRLDTKPNFSGTSAAAPHAAAIAALVPEANGGPGSVRPAKMMKMLHKTTFQHDLDPNYASGKANTSDGGVVRFTANTDFGLNPSSGVNNVNHLTIFYIGPGAITSIVFNPEGTAQLQPAIPPVETMDLISTNTYFSNVYPGIVFQPNTKAFTLGDSQMSASGDISCLPSATRLHCLRSQVSGGR